jgi:hypothetical protein
MITRLTLLLLALLAAPVATFAQSVAKGLEHSVVTIDITRKQYDYLRPWIKSSHSANKTGVVIGPREILTTAEDIHDLTLARLQKDGRGAWSDAKVLWVDFHSNLALIGCDDAAFWKDLKPVALAYPMPSNQPFQIIRWRNGNLENRKAEFSQFTVDDVGLGWVDHLEMELSSEIKAAGEGEPVIVGNKVAGLVAAQAGSTCKVLPSSFIKPILDAHRAGTYRGLGYFHFVWQVSQNPASLRHLKLAGDPRGVIVSEVPKKAGMETAIKPLDIILQIDGFDIDNEGYYHDPEYGHLILENLATRKHWAGDKIKIKVSREGKELDLFYELPKAEFTSKALTDQILNAEPEYLIAGGFVFQPLTKPFLRSWGSDWKRNAPFRLSYYDNDSSSVDRAGLVVLSAVLPDPSNIGYQDARYLVVDSINGVKITSLKDVQSALKQPKDGFHQVQFMRGDSLQHMVLDAASLDQATARITSRYGIAEAVQINDPKAN